MSFSDIENRITVSEEFPLGGKAAILAAICFIYEESPTATKMFDEWLGMWPENIEVIY